MSALPLADGPAMYLGGSIMTFALPYGAFIVATIALYFLFRARHSGPRLKYLGSAQVSSVTTREPGPAPAPSVALPAEPPTASPDAASPDPDTAPPETGGGGET